MNRINRTLSQTGEGDGFAAAGYSSQAIRVAQLVLYRLVAANRNRRRLFEYNLRSFPPTLQYRFGSRPISHLGNEAVLRVGVNR